MYLAIVYWMASNVSSPNWTMEIQQRNKFARWSIEVFEACNGHLVGPVEFKGLVSNLRTFVFDSSYIEWH